MNADKLAPEEAIKKLERMCPPFGNGGPYWEIIDALKPLLSKRSDADKLAEALRDFLEAQDSLDNRELQGINAEDYFTLQRRRNSTREDLDSILAAYDASQRSESDGCKDKARMDWLEKEIGPGHVGALVRVANLLSESPFDFRAAIDKAMGNSPVPSDGWIPVGERLPQQKEVDET